ncbi:MAG: biosynthetic-type acetolactate synthase large subunit [Anaerolineales bacterium]|nr:biosynthetic-type acetolactate synthase large subunit [Anaerolineales bacterium]
MKRTGAEIVWECLLREGVDTVFGYPGGASLPIYDAMKNFDIHHVLGRHEQGLTHMADGYARATGRVGVAMATSGPGATNMVTGIATAYMDSSPIVCITGQVASQYVGFDAFQETDVTGVTQPITKHNYLVTRAEEIMPTIRKAFYIARSGRPGPVLVDICKDAQQHSIDWEYDDTPIAFRGYRPDLRPATEKIKQAAEMINQAKRPVILAGRGVLMSGGTELLRRFAEKAQVPVGLTLLGIGAMPASHPLTMGMMGMHGESWVNEAIQEADLLLAFGMRFDDRVTGTVDTYARDAKKLHIDIDPSELNKNVPVDLGLVGDLKEILEQVEPLVKPADHEEWVDHIWCKRKESGIRDIQNLPDSGHLYAPHVINDLWRFTEGEALVVSDVGQHQMWTAQYYRHDLPMRFITSGGLGTMGFGLPAGIGAKIGCPECNVWVIAGDGGFQMTQAELSTAAQEGVKVNVAIMNNGFLGMVRQWQEFFYDKNYAATPMRSPDFIKIAEAHGLTGLRVTERSQVEAAIKQAHETEGAVVIDFRVEQEDSVYPMVPSGVPLDKMIRRPSPIVETARDR